MLSFNNLQQSLLNCVAKTNPFFSLADRFQWAGRREAVVAANRAQSCLKNLFLFFDISWSPFVFGPLTADGLLGSAGALSRRRLGEGGSRLRVPVYSFAVHSLASWPLELAARLFQPLRPGVGDRRLAPV